MFVFCPKSWLNCFRFRKKHLISRDSFQTFQTFQKTHFISADKNKIIQQCFFFCWAAPMVHSYRLGLVTWRYQILIPVRTDICHRGCAYTVLQTVKRHGVYSAAYGTVHYKEPVKSFEIIVGHSPGFGLPYVAILPWLCRKRRRALFIHFFILGLNMSALISSHIIICSFKC